MAQFKDRLKWRQSITWDREGKRVKSERHLKLGALTLKRKPLHEPDAEEIRKVFLNGIREAGIECLPWNKNLR